MTFGQRFKKLRVEKGLNQKELVDDFNERYGYNFSKAAISLYENDKRRPETQALLDFALYFGASLDYLLCISENREVNNLETKFERNDFMKFAKDFFNDPSIDEVEKRNLFKEITLRYLAATKQ